MNVKAKSKEKIGFEIPPDLLPNQVRTQNSDSLNGIFLSYKDVLDHEKSKKAGFPVFDEKKIADLKEAQLIYINKNKRNLTYISKEAYYDKKTGQTYGGKMSQPDDQGKMIEVPNRWNIVDLVTRLNLETTDGRNQFIAALSSIDVQGSFRARFPYNFKVIVPSMVADQTVEKEDLISDMRIAVKEMTEEKMDEVSTLLNLSSFTSMSLQNKKAMLYKIAQENPKKIQAVLGSDKTLELLFIRAEKAKIITKGPGGIYRFAEFEMGATERNAIKWLEQNPNIQKLIEEAVENEQ